MFNYKVALVRKLPSTFANALCRSVPAKPIDLEKAEKQHKEYVNTVSKLVPKVYVIDNHNSFPDCVFIEDTCVVIGNKVLINNMGHESRRGEIISVQKMFITLEYEIYRMYGFDETLSPSRGLIAWDDPCLDGGDVLVIGNKIFVGLSERTNKAGYKFLESVFGTVYPIQYSGALHLKSLVTVLDEESIVVAEDEENVDDYAGLEVFRRIRDILPNIKIVKVPDQICANVLRIHDTVIIQKGFPRSEKILKKAIEDRKLKCIELEMSEFAKANGALTCCSVLI